MEPKQQQKLLIRQEKQGEEEEKEMREKHFHVLAVDDSLIERKMLEKILTISSYHVTCVESGDKALEYLGLMDHKSDDNDHGDHSHDSADDDVVVHSLPSADQQTGQGAKINLIMTDYSMPGINGYDLLKRVKRSSWKDVPVVVMSSENVPSRIDM